VHDETRLSSIRRFTPSSASFVPIQGRKAAALQAARNEQMIFLGEKRAAHW